MKTNALSTQELLDKLTHALDDAQTVFYPLLREQNFPPYFAFKLSQVFNELNKMQTQIQGYEGRIKDTNFKQRKKTQKKASFSPEDFYLEDQAALENESTLGRITCS